MKHNKIKAQRILLGVSTQEIARELEIKENEYLAIENGDKDLNLETIAKLESILNIKILPQPVIKITVGQCISYPFLSLMTDSKGELHQCIKI